MQNAGQEASKWNGIREHTPIPTKHKKTTFGALIGRYLKEVNRTIRGAEADSARLKAIMRR